MYSDKGIRMKRKGGVYEQAFVKRAKGVGRGIPCIYPASSHRVCHEGYSNRPHSGQIATMPGNEAKAYLTVFLHRALSAQARNFYPGFCFLKGPWQSAVD